MTARSVVDAIDAAALPANHQQSFALRVVALADGSDLMVPVHVATGRDAGPVVAIVAGVHGDEPDGMAALLDLWADIPRLEFAGTMMLVPVANPSAFAAHQRRSPIDGVDLNRSFPGDPAGSVSQRLAAALYRLVINNADCLFTLHSWFATGDCIAHVEFQNTDSPVREASLAAAIGSGFAFVRAADWHPGLLPRAVTAAGIPAIEAEIGGLGITRAANVALYRRHIDNLLGHLGIVAGAGCEAADLHLCNSVDVVSPFGGILRSSVKPGQTVDRGQLMATVSALHGEPTVDVVAPQHGIVLAARHALSTSAGEILYRIGIRQSPKAAQHRQLQS